MNGKYWYVDEDFHMLAGEEAKQALATTSDAAYLSNDQGIVEVPRQRWERAQAFERNCWMVQNTKSSDDRNWDHYSEFDGYRTLRRLTFEHAIELGCGPFTNLRLMLKACRIKKLTLLDPLTESYFDHPRCRYDKQWLFTDNWLHETLDKPRLLRGVRRVIRRLAPQLLYDRHPVHQFICKPIEEMPTLGRYDLIVIINVIEHCYNVYGVLENMLKIAAPGAVLVFADKYYEHEPVSQLVRGHYYEVGHPLMVDRGILDRFMERHFDCLYRKTARKQIEHIEVMPEYTGFYFIGRRKN